MGANSAARRLLKRMLYPVLNEHTYKYIQALSKAWDIRSGKWSEPELDLIPLAVRPGETVLDIGANYGVYSYHLSRAVGSSGRVYAFEPVPFTFATLQLVARILRFHNVGLLEKGCSDKGGEITFAVPVQPSGAIAAGQAFVGRRNDDRAGKEKQVRWSGTRNIVCEVITLDEFLPQPAELSFIKCDIEGAELFAFRGAEKLITSHLPTVVCEINPWFLEGFGVRLEELTDFFFSKGYGLYFYDTERGNRQLKAVGLNDVVEDNFVFIHPRRRDRFAALLN
jgi:FkbM family methyltransferase